MFCIVFNTVGVWYILCNIHLWHWRIAITLFLQPVFVITNNKNERNKMLQQTQNYYPIRSSFPLQKQTQETSTRHNTTENYNNVMNYLDDIDSISSIEIIVIINNNNNNREKFYFSTSNYIIFFLFVVVVHFSLSSSSISNRFISLNFIFLYFL